LSLATDAHCVEIPSEEVPPKRQFLQEPHGVTSQKTPFFIVTAVKTSNLTSVYETLLYRIELVAVMNSNVLFPEYVSGVSRRTLCHVARFDQVTLTVLLMFKLTQYYKCSFGATSDQVQIKLLYF
jgi:hypothetical protein